jgi:hypothetical protein
VSAAAELFREALRDPSIRAEILQLVQAAKTANDTPREPPEPLVDAHEAARLLGMTVGAVRAASYRGTVKSTTVGRSLRFRPSDLIRRKR